MKSEKILARTAGLLLLIVFGFNIYIGLYDTTLNLLSPLHHSLNWIIAGISFITAAVLFVKPGSRLWVSLGGVVWPILYIFSLFLDVDTLLCFGTNFSCWPSVADAYDYLILGSRAEGWVLWPYTMRVVISILIIVVILSALSLVLNYSPSRRKSQKVNKKFEDGASSQ